MRNLTFTALALCACAPAIAQTPGGLTVANKDAFITLYGILDAGVCTIAHAANFSEYSVVGNSPTASKTGNGSTTGMFNGGISPSRIGLRGGVDLGGDWKGVFTLEAAISPVNGTISNAGMSISQNVALSATGGGPAFSGDSALSGQLFGRGAFFGVSSATYGTLTFGRHTSFMTDIISPYDPLDGAQLFTPVGYSGSYGGGGATDNSRVDSSIKYKFKSGDFSLGLLHKFGGVSGHSGAKGTDQFMVAYEHGSFGITASYQSYKDAFTLGNPAGTINPTLLSAPAATLAATKDGTVVYQPLGTVTLTAQDTKATLFTARYKVGPVYFKGGWQKQQFTNPSNPTADAQITSMMGQTVGTAVYGGVIAPAVSVTPYTVGGVAMEKDLTLMWLGASWQATSSLTLAAAYYHVAQNDYSNGAAAPGSRGTGAQAYTSLLIDYAFTKSLDAYVAYMGSKNTDSQAVGYINPSNSVTGLGLRYRF